MKISQSPDNPVALNSNAASQAAKTAPVASALAQAAGQNTKPAGVAVTVSSMARSLKSGASSQPPEVDMAKVDTVRSAIANGTYVVNAGAIADKLLSNAQEMLPRSPI